MDVENNQKPIKKFSFAKIDTNNQRLIIFLVILLIIASVTKSENFLKVSNFQSIGVQLTEYGLMALGVGICMISGGIDLSTVYISNLCGISAALLMQKLIPTVSAEQQIFVMILAIFVAMIIGLICGMFNGVLISYFHIPAMLATLGSYQLFMGISIVISDGRSVSVLPDSFSIISTSSFAGIPMPFIIFVLCAIILTFVMKRTKFGTRVYLVGTNAKAGKFAGINYNWTIIKTYMISGLLSSIAGIISLSRINSAKADFGSSYTMQCILIVVLGGVNPNGGFGNIPGIAIAVVILQVISSYLNMFPNVSNYYRDLIWGLALVFVLIMNYETNRRKTLKLSKH